jgi:hypothetical protein
MTFETRYSERRVHATPHFIIGACRTGRGARHGRLLNRVCRAVWLDIMMPLH